nr:leucine-rich receptor-like protein kinase family protein [Tanacetum cinerariifolium]
MSTTTSPLPMTSSSSPQPIPPHRTITTTATRHSHHRSTVRHHQLPAATTINIISSPPPLCKHLKVRVGCSHHPKGALIGCVSTKGAYGLHNIGTKSAFGCHIIRIGRVWFCFTKAYGCVWQSPHHEGVFVLWCSAATRSEVAKHLGVARIEQQNGLVDETNVTLFAKVLHGFEFEVEPLGDHTFEVEPQENVDQGAGLQEVQTQDLMDYQLARDREQHLACKLLGYREDNTGVAFVVAAVDKIYPHASLTFNNTVSYEVISKFGDIYATVERGRNGSLGNLRYCCQDFSTAIGFKNKINAALWNVSTAGSCLMLLLRVLVLLGLKADTTVCLVIGWDKDSIKLKMAIFGIIEDVVTKIIDYHLFDVVVEFYRAGFSVVITPLFDTMMVQAPADTGDTPVKTHQTPIVDQPSTSKPQKKQKPKRKQRNATEEDASKQGRMIKEVDQNAEIAREEVVMETTTGFKDSVAPTIDVTEDEVRMAQAWAELKSTKPKVVVQEQEMSTTIPADAIIVTIVVPTTRAKVTYFQPRETLMKELDASSILFPGAAEPSWT